MMRARAEVGDRQTEPEAAGWLLRWAYEEMLARYGPQGWWPGETRLEVVVGAVLTQATAWRNVERALSNLRAAGTLDLAQMLEVSEASLAGMIRPAGFFRVKARRLRALFDHIAHAHGGDLMAFLHQEPGALRQALLGVPGIGHETADCIALYAAQYPYFVVDAYTRRILQRLSWWSAGSYAEAQSWFHAHLPREASLFNEFHALLVRHAKDICRPRPRCADCCIRERCAFGLALTDAP